LGVPLRVRLTAISFLRKKKAKKDAALILNAGPISEHLLLVTKTQRSGANGSIPEISGSETISILFCLQS